MAFKFNPPRSTAAPSPTTPNRKAGKSSFFSQAPSTTPAGEPPSYLTNLSTTPSAHPPRSSKIFGSSYHAANNTFGHRNTPARRGRAFAVPESSPPRDDDDEDADADGEAIDEGYATHTGQHAPGVVFSSPLGGEESPRGFKRSRNGQIREQVDSEMADIARAHARDAGPARLGDSDEVVLRTEEAMSLLENANAEQHPGARDASVASAASQVATLWAAHASAKTKSGSIGPAASDGLTRANYIASLLLRLHTPHVGRPGAAATGSRALMNPSYVASQAATIPSALLDWLNTYHKPLGDDFDEIHMYSPSPSAHESFWDLVGGELLRGQFPRVIRLLKDAGFEYAITAQDDGSASQGYEGKQLENVEEVVARFVETLETSPAVIYDDWDVKGAEWSVFRQRVRRAIKDLGLFAKGNDAEDDEDPLTQSQPNIFAQSTNGPSFGNMAAASLRARSRVPWSIFENLKILYGVLLGGDEIVDYAQDWLESSIFLTVWWDGEETPAPSVSLIDHNSLRRSHGPSGAGTREVDVSPFTAYRRRLGDMLRSVTDQIEEANFKPDTLDPVQVGLVCVMEGTSEAAIELLRTFDQTITASIVEIGALGGWLQLTQPNGRGLLQHGFSAEDLMVLSHGPGQQHPSSLDSVDSDEILTTYADALSARDVFRSSDGKTVREGWELAVSVLGRLGDVQASQDRIATVLEGIHFDDGARVDKVLQLCANMGFEQQARDIAERYADNLAEDQASPSYGSALTYYARAHATQKLTSTISLLISLCLLQSAAVPATHDSDELLRSLLSGDRAALLHLAGLDLEAATLLSRQISGYATVRKFYDLRDDTSGNLKSLERRRSAATALIAIIDSASDCIRGGLFDPEVQTVVPIDGLLALLGEALPLLNQEKRIFTKDQIFTLLRVVEDFETVSARIREGAVDLLQASINAYRGVLPSSHTTRSGASYLSGSDLTGSSSWDMLLSTQSLLQSQESELVRGWDWRKGLDAVVGAKVESKEVIGLLRVALAREVARGWGGAFIGW